MQSNVKIASAATRVMCRTNDPAVREAARRITLAAMRRDMNSKQAEVGYGDLLGQLGNKAMGDAGQATNQYVVDPVFQRAGQVGAQANAALQKAQNFGSQVGQGYNNMVGNLSNGMVNAYQGAQNLGNQATQAIGQGAQGLVNNVAGGAKAVGGALNSAGTALGSGAVNAMNGYQGLQNAAYNAIGQGAQGLASNVASGVDGLSTLGSQLGRVAGNVPAAGWGALGSAAGQAIPGIGGAAMGLKGLNAVGNSINNAAGSTWGAIGHGLSSIFGPSNPFSALGMAKNVYNGAKSLGQGYRGFWDRLFGNTPGPTPTVGRSLPQSPAGTGPTTALPPASPTPGALNPAMDPGKIPGVQTAIDQLSPTSTETPGMQSIIEKPQAGTPTLAPPPESLPETPGLHSILEKPKTGTPTLAPPQPTAATPVSGTPTLAPPQPTGSMPRSQLGGGPPTSSQVKMPTPAPAPGVPTLAANPAPIRRRL